nr:response regulator [Geomonas sp. Red32]
MGGLQDSDYWVTHTYAVIAEVNQLGAALTDAETSQRGYLITGNSAYLEPYRKALSTVRDKRSLLRTLTKDNSNQQMRLDMMDPMIERKVAQLDQTVEARKSKGLQAVAPMVMTHLSDNLMTSIRAMISQMEVEEEQLLRERAARKQAEMLNTMHVMEAGGLVATVILLAIFALMRREVVQRTRAEVDLLERNAELQESQERVRAQNWIKSGLSDLSRSTIADRPLGELVSASLAFLADYLKAGAGVLHLYDEESRTLRPAAGYAFAGGSLPERELELGEGLAGEAGRQQRAIYRDGLPDGYLKVESALGTAAPRALAVLPLVHDKTLVGVIELATLHEFTLREREFLEQASELLAIAISGRQARHLIDELLAQSRSQEEELRVQQEELQQINEELEERAQLLEQQREEIQAKNRLMQEKTRELAKKAQEIEQVSSYKSEFLANMSHELRTPLNSLMILSGSLRDNKEGNLTARQVEYASTIQAAGTELLNLINDILDLSKIESGRLEFLYGPSRPAELCGQLAAAFGPVAEQKGLVFGITVEEGVPAELTLDSQRTLQVLKNLLSNAIKFTREGAVRLRTYLPGPDSPLATPSVAFEVTDTGVGVPAAKHELIFQAFQQADGSTSRQFGGTGLGLSISRQLARGMGGEVLVASGDGKGSVFTLYLPLAPPAAAATPAAPGAPDGQGRHPGNIEEPPLPLAAPPVPDDRERLNGGDRTILIVEDDPIFARLLADRVRERGFAALVSADGDSALTLARRYRPSAILLDVMLPGTDGWGVMQRITEDPEIRHIPVHFLSCLEERQKALAMGAIGFVTKPVTSEQLDQVLGAVEEAVDRTVGKLLIVEDNEREAAALVALLEQRDVAITVADSGARAIGLLTAEPFDCVVLDLGLADMSGFDLLEHIRTMEESRRVPVIIHTGQELSREDAHRLQQYAESIIIKGAKSPERLLNEVTLFLHVMESRLPPDKQRMIRTALDNESLLVGKKVLLADDDMRNVFSLSSVLTERGMRVVEAENGRVALERLEENTDVNVVLMDIMMPEMDGYEAIRRIRQDPRFGRLPIIALTAKAMKGDREACLKAGASDYITKPVDLDRLLSLLRVWLYNHG